MFETSFKLSRPVLGMERVCEIDSCFYINFKATTEGSRRQNIMICIKLSYQASNPFYCGRDPFNQNSSRFDREKWSTSKGGPVFPVGPNRFIEFWTEISGSFG